MTLMSVRTAAVGVAVLLLAAACSTGDGLSPEEAFFAASSTGGVSLPDGVTEVPGIEMVSGGCGSGGDGIVGGGDFDFWFSGEVVLPSGVEGVAPRVRSVGVHAVPNSTEQHRSLGSRDFELEMRNSSDKVVASVFFRLDPPGLYSEHVGTYEYVVASEVDLEVQDVRRFGVWVFDTPVFESYAILWQGKELAVVNQTADAPAVELSGVSEGQFVGSDEKIELCLAASDGAGDDLAYRVYYSTDGGASYGLHQQLTDAAGSGGGVSELVLDASDVAGSDTARVGISVSDGARATFVETPVFTVGQHAPEVSIEVSNPRVILDRGLGYLMRVRAHDAEDGYLKVGDVSLHSSVDGPLRVSTGFIMGSFFTREKLTLGHHVITARATDSSGKSTIASIAVSAILGESPPDAVDDVVHVPLFKRSLIDVLDNDYIYNRQSFTIIQSPTLGESGSQVSQNPFLHPEFGGLHLGYMGTSSGLDKLRYQICDVSTGCATATVEIHVGIGDCTILGTSADDRLVGTPGDDIICGLGGDDTIDGAGGDDIIRGGTGDDILTGGPGDDYIRGEPGNDIIKGDAGRDILFGGTGDDVIYGGEGYDILSGADKIGEQQPTDELYYDNTQTPISFDELTDTEAETIDKAITKCQQAVPEPFFEARDTRSQCPDLLTSLCRTATPQNSQKPLTDDARKAALDFICSTANLAELGEIGYLMPHSEIEFEARDDTYMLVKDRVSMLYDILAENVHGISEGTIAKLRELTQTINLFATQAYQRLPPIHF